MTMDTSRSSLQRTNSLSPRARRRNTPSSVICSASPRLRSSQVRNQGSSRNIANTESAMPVIHQLVLPVQAG